MTDITMILEYADNSNITLTPLGMEYRPSGWEWDEEPEFIAIEEIEDILTNHTYVLDHSILPATKHKVGAEIKMGRLTWILINSSKALRLRYEGRVYTLDAIKAVEAMIAHSDILIHTVTIPTSLPSLWKGSKVDLYHAKMEVSRNDQVLRTLYPKNIFVPEALSHWAVGEDKVALIPKHVKIGRLSKPFVSVGHTWWKICKVYRPDSNTFEAVDRDSYYLKHQGVIYWIPISAIIEINTNS